MNKLAGIIKVIRVNQWIKNLSLYAAIIFTANLFTPVFFLATTYGFFVFCALSSASYVFNDLVDAPYDRNHPRKRFRPIAMGTLSIQEAMIIFFILATLGLSVAYFLGIGFFLISTLFFLLHIGYTLWLKKHAILDIIAIASSFLTRVFAGEAITGLHIPIWLTFSVIFLSLFIASCKRRSELVAVGNKTRPALEHYRAQLLDFYNSTFATGTIITYAMFTFQAQAPDFNPLIHDFLLFVFPQALGRKWLMVSTLPLIVVGIMRYAQLIYEREAVGESPEKLVTTDKPLIATIALWGFSVILFTYIL
ncbi:UbiA prenyltransferase family protein [Candidatus Roizmanbacteria bacterium]|nr:UbiA prenyltransferase family protein [Candidatus Roizmanbacteria bacterium]